MNKEILIYLGLNVSKYHDKKYIKRAIKIVKHFFKNKKNIKIFYPYTLSILHQEKLLKKFNMQATRVFLKDIVSNMKRFDYFIIMPMENSYIGTGTFLELILAKIFKVKTLIINPKNNKVYKKFKLLNLRKKSILRYNSHIRHTYYKAVKFIS